MSNLINKSIDPIYKKCDHLTGQRAYMFVHELSRKCKPQKIKGIKRKVSINMLCREAEVSRHTVYGWHNKPDTIPDVAILMRLVEAARANGARI
jgi:hypothetical protein